MDADKNSFGGLRKIGLGLLFDLKKIKIKIKFIKY